MKKKSPGVVLGQKFNSALDYVRIIQGSQMRKETDLPLIAHLLGVAALTVEYGGGEEVAIAALLHDAVEENGGVFRLQEIRRQFGERVGNIVALCSDGVVEEVDKKKAWWERKVTYIEHLSSPEMSADAALVSCADKLHNVRAIMADYRRCGEDLWQHFNRRAGRLGELWYYRSLAAAFRTKASTNERWPALVEEFVADVDNLFGLVGTRIGDEQIAADLRLAEERVQAVRQALGGSV